MSFTQETVNMMCDQLQKGFKAAVEIMFTSLSDRVRTLERENVELRIFLDTTQKELDILKHDKCSKEDLANMEIELNKLEFEVASNFEKCTNRSDQIEDYTRIENILIDGIKEDDGWENEEVTEAKVSKMLKDKLKMDDVKIEIAHRLGRRHAPAGDAPPKPRTIIAKLTHRRDRNAIMRSRMMLKNTKIFINEDMCSNSFNKKMDQMPKFRKARDEGKQAFFRGSELIIRDAPRPPTLSTESVAESAAESASGSAASAHNLLEPEKTATKPNGKNTEQLGRAEGDERLERDHTSERRETRSKK